MPVGRTLTDILLHGDAASAVIPGVRENLDVIEQIQSLWPDHPISLLAVVPTSVNSNTHASRATMEALEQDPRLGPALFRHGIRQCLDLTYATAQGQTIWEYAPRSRAAEDYGALVHHVRTVLTGKDPFADGEVAHAEEDARPHAS